MRETERPPHQDEAASSPLTPEERLDEALEETFPASDAPAMTIVTAVRPAPLPSKERRSVAIRSLSSDGRR